MNWNYTTQNRKSENAKPRKTRLVHVHPEGRIFNSEWFVNSFAMVVCEKIFLVVIGHSIVTELHWTSFIFIWRSDSDGQVYLCVCACVRVCVRRWDLLNKQDFLSVLFECLCVRVCLRVKTRTVELFNVFSRVCMSVWEGVPTQFNGVGGPNPPDLGPDQTGKLSKEEGVHCTGRWNRDDWAWSGL